MPAPTLIRPRWVDPEPVPAAAVELLAGELALPPEVCRLLIRRGHDTPDAVRRFLRPSFEDLHPVSLLADAPRAAARILEAVERDETVLVHGDYDADGLCAAALLLRGLSRIGARTVGFVPHRLRDGYDFGDAGLGRAEEVGADLIVTADCGVSAVGPVAAARREGRDVVVTDHHRPPERLPEAHAVVHPGRGDAGYPFAELAGVGVAFKLLTAVWETAGREPSELNDLLDLVAVGTVADVVPLRDENRVLVRAGLGVLRRTRNLGLRALVERAGLEGEVSAGQVAWVLGPRLNAVGRIGEPELALRLLTTDDEGEAARLAERLERHNSERQEEERSVQNAALREADRRYDTESDRSLVLWGEDWHPGVVGIVASRLVDRFHRPVALIALDGDRGRGSARSIRGFHLHAALVECADRLERFGGHEGAAGFEIRREQLEPFARAFEEVARRELAAEALSPEIRVDLDVPLGSAGRELHEMLRHLAPFGAGNPRPVLASRGLRLEQVRRVGREGQHLKARLREGDAELEAIGFRMGELCSRLGGRDRWDAAYHLVEDRWRGEARLQARLEDLRPTV